MMSKVALIVGAAASAIFIAAVVSMIVARAAAAIAPTLEQCRHPAATAVACAAANRNSA